MSRTVLVDSVFTLTENMSNWKKIFVGERIGLRQMPQEALY